MASETSKILILSSSDFNQHWINFVSHILKGEGVGVDQADPDQSMRNVHIQHEKMPYRRVVADYETADCYEKIFPNSMNPRYHRPPLVYAASALTLEEVRRALQYKARFFLTKTLNEREIRANLLEPSA